MSPTMTSSIRLTLDQATLLIDAFPAMVWICNADGNAEFFNRKWYELTGQSPETSIPTGWGDVIHPEDGQQLADSWEQLRQSDLTEYEFDLRYRMADGSYVWHMVRAVPICDETGVMTKLIGFSTASDRKRLDDELRGQTIVLEQIAKGKPLDQVLHKLIEVAEATRPEMLGSVLLLEAPIPCCYSEKKSDSGCGPSASERSPARLRHGASISLPKSFTAAIDGVPIGPNVGSCGTAAFTGERVIVEDIFADPLWDDYREFARVAGVQACWSHPILSSGGEVLGTFAMYYRHARSPAVEDLEFVANCANLAALAIERARADEAKRQSAARLRQVIDTVPHMIFAKNGEGKVLLANKASAAMFGLSVAEVEGSFQRDFHANPAEDEQMIAADRQVIESGEPLFIPEEILTDGGNHQRKIQVIKIPFTESPFDEPAMLGVATDITDLKNAESRLVQAERLAAIGQMLSAIAHESRNALQRIRSGVDMLQLDIDPDSEAGGDLAQISRARADLQHLLDELRNYAAPLHLELETHNLATIWQRAWNNLSVVRENRAAQLCERIECEQLECRLDAFRIEQVFRNLFENALDACADPVQISIRCCNQQLRDQPALCIEVQDNGAGFSLEQADQIFDPFFSTKPRGTGLGMAIAKRIIEAHHGRILASNGAVKECGAKITILIPLHACNAGF